MKVKRSTAILFLLFATAAVVIGLVLQLKTISSGGRDDYHSGTRDHDNLA